MITFADYPMVLEDSAGKLSRWIEQNLSVEDLRIFGWLPASHLTQMTSKDYGGIPLRNHGRPLRPKLNTLYWPTDASRWACGLFLANTTNKNKMLTAIGLDNERKELLIAEPEPDNPGGGTSSKNPPGIALQMHMLPPRPLVVRNLVEGGEFDPEVDGDEPEGLWLIPLVDCRWYWQWKNTGNFSPAETWTDQFSTLASLLGITLNVDDIASEYLCPGKSVLTRQYDNAAVLLDALAHSVGRRVVFDWAADNGNRAQEAEPDTFRLMAYDEGNLVKRDQNVKRTVAGLTRFNGYDVAGDQFDDQNEGAVLPESVIVTFRKRENAVAVENEFYTVEVAATEVGWHTYTADATKIFRDSAFADFTTGPDPDNLYDLESLATRIATDFYESQAYMHDRTFASIQWIDDTPWLDYVEYSLGRRRADGTYEAQTREHGNGYNLGMEELWHGACNEDPPIPAFKKKAKLKTRLDVANTAEFQGRATADLYEWNGLSWQDSYEDIEVYARAEFQGLLFGDDEGDIRDLGADLPYYPQFPLLDIEREDNLVIDGDTGRWVVKGSGITVIKAYLRQFLTATGRETDSQQFNLRFETRPLDDGVGGYTTSEFDLVCNIDRLLSTHDPDTIGAGEDGALCLITYEASHGFWSVHSLEQPSYEDCVVLTWCSSPPEWHEKFLGSNAPVGSTLLGTLLALAPATGDFGGQTITICEPCGPGFTTTTTTTTPPPCCANLPSTFPFVFYDTSGCDFGEQEVTMTKLSDFYWEWDGVLECGDAFTIGLTCNAGASEVGCAPFTLHYTYPCAGFDADVSVSDCVCDPLSFVGELVDFGDVSGCVCCAEPYTCQDNGCGTCVRIWSQLEGEEAPGWHIFSTSCTGDCILCCTPPSPGTVLGQMETVGCCNGNTLPCSG